MGMSDGVEGNVVQATGRAQTVGQWGGVGERGRANGLGMGEGC